MTRDWNLEMRPTTWEHVVGQKHLMGTFWAMVNTDAFPPFSIFSGPSGVGKSCVAEIIAKAITCTGENDAPCEECKNCKDFNAGRSTSVIKYDIPNMTDEEIVQMMNSIFNVDLVGRKVFIIEEAHKMSKDGTQPKWLEPTTKIPANVTIIFCTTSLYGIINTLRNRASRFSFELPSDPDCMDLIQRMSEQFHFALPSEKILRHFIKMNKNSPRSIIRTLQNCALSNTLSDAELKKYLRIQDDNSATDMFCSLIDNSVDLYSMVRLIHKDEETTATDILRGLKELVLEILLELSLGQKQAITQETRERLQVLLADGGERKLKRIVSFVGDLTEECIEDKQSAELALVKLKLTLLELTSSKIATDNLGNASKAYAESIDKTIAKESKADAAHAPESTGLVKSAEEIRRALNRS